MLKVEELDFTGLSDIEVRYAMVQSRVWKYIRYLIVRYAGEYRDGSAGNPDARYMYAMAEAGAAAFRGEGVILDLSALSYQWGDKIDILFNVGAGHDRGNDPYPLAILVGAGCAPALASLMFGIDTKRPVTDHEWFFDGLDGALAYLDSFDRPNWERLDT